MSSQYLGANIDIRPEESRVKDIHIVELVASATPVEWKEKSETQWRKFPVQDQDGSGSCVAQTVKKLSGILLFLKEGRYAEFSATSIYQERSNKPASGMMGVEAFDIWKDKGITLEALVPSSQMSDSQMDSQAIEEHEKQIAQIFRVGGHVGIPSGDFETVASVIQQTGKGVMVWFYFGADEWSKRFPSVNRPMEYDEGGALRHSVPAVDFGLIDGKKYLKIEDSAHFGGISERWISEEFFAVRNWFARYPMNFKFEEKLNQLDRPTYTFTKPLEFIPLDEDGNIPLSKKHEAQSQDVIALQNILKFEGLFPSNVQSTGYYGATTARAVYNWQVKHNVASLAELDSVVPKGGRVGSKTITSLNDFYAK